MPRFEEIARRVFLGSSRELLPDEKHHESNLFWGPISIGLSIVLTVVAAMKNDLRFLFWGAWLFFSFGAFHLSRRIRYKALSLWVAFVSSILVGFSLYGLSGWLQPVKSAPSGTPPPAVLTALYIGCGFDHIPITIQPGGVAHIMWLDPAMLQGNPNIPYAGPFDDIPVPFTGKSLTWPSNLQGEWLTRERSESLIKSSGQLPTPMAFRCQLSNYAVTLDQITLPLLVDTSDGARHEYQVPFNPSVVGQPFVFYMVNRCTFGSVPTMVQWEEYATVRVLGEEGPRRIPLQFDRKSWPSNLAIYGASSFVWNDRKDGCNWSGR